jgi:hypothetical protein
VSYEWSESLQAFVVRVPAVPVSALRALVKDLKANCWQPARIAGLAGELAALCEQAEKA